MKFVVPFFCMILLPISAYADFYIQGNKNSVAIRKFSANLAKYDAEMQTLHQGFKKEIGKMTSLIGENQGSYAKILLALNGTSPTANLHDDLAQILSSVNNKTIASLKQASSVMKSEKRKQDLATDAIAGNLETASAKEANCQADLIASAVDASDVQSNPIVQKAVAGARNMVIVRSKTMRNQSADKELMVKEQAAKFCSQADFEGGACKEEDVCQPDDPSCSAMSDRSASMFLSDGYKTIAEQEGAMRFIMNITDPFPKQVKRKSALTNENLNNDSYKYKKGVEEAWASIPGDVLRYLWSLRVNIYEGDPSLPVTKMLDNVNSADQAMLDRAKMHKGRVFSAPDFVPLAAVLQKDGDMAAPGDSPPLNGAISKIELDALMLSSMYGNVVWETSLTLSPDGFEAHLDESGIPLSSSGDYRIAIGRALAFNAKQKTEMLYKLDMLAMIRAARLSKAD